jgi:hypothetical protein
MELLILGALTAVIFAVVWAKVTKNADKANRRLALRVRDTLTDDEQTDRFDHMRETRHAEKEKGTGPPWEGQAGGES